MKYCHECGTALVERELEHEGMVSFCPRCNDYRFPMYNVAVSMIIINEENRKTLLVKQYGKDFFRLVAGYVNRTEARRNINPKILAGQFLNEGLDDLERPGESRQRES